MLVDKGKEFPSRMFQGAQHLAQPQCRAVINTIQHHHSTVLRYLQYHSTPCPASAWVSTPFTAGCRSACEPSLFSLAHTSFSRQDTLSHLQCLPSSGCSRPLNYLNCLTFGKVISLPSNYSKNKTFPTES